MDKEVGALSDGLRTSERHLIEDSALDKMFVGLPPQSFAFHPLS